MTVPMMSNAGNDTDRIQDPPNPATPPLVITHDPAWIRYVAWAMLILIAVLQAWASRHAMNPDGISYLELAGAAVRGDWSETINAYWSPVYPTLLAVGLAVLQPDSYLEFTVARVVNFVIFLIALGAFEFFLSQLLRARTRLDVENSAAPHIPIWVWRLIGYAAFGWAALVLRGLGAVTPDLVVVAVVFAAAGIIVRLAFSDSGLSWFAGLGAVLAFGYLTKAAMLPLSCPLLLAAWISGHPRRGRGVPVACAVFVAIAGLYVAVLSAKEKRFTVGDTGKLNYAWFVNGVPRYTHWHGEPAGTGTVRHPSLVLDYPATYSFADPIPGAYPLWYDPSYWHDGLIVRFNLVRQIKKTAAEIQQIPWIVADLLMALVALFVLYRRKAIDIQRRNLLLLGIPLAAAIGMYSLVHIEPRFLAGFLGVFVASLLLFVRARSHAGMEATLVVVVALAVVLSVRTLEMGVNGVREIAKQVEHGKSAHENWVIASELRRYGLPAGAIIGFVGDGFREYWAHIGGYRIGSEVAPLQFEKADPAAREKALEALVATRPNAILADTVYGCDKEYGWTPIPNTALCSYEPREAARTLGGTRR